MMGRKPKLYVPLVVGFFDDDRIIAAGDGPTLLYLAMLLRAKMLGSDGRLSEAQISRLNRPKWRNELRRLAEVEAVIWDEQAEEWFIASWFSHNDAISAIEARRAADRARKQNSGRIPDGIQSDGGRIPLSRKKEEGREEEGRDPAEMHAFVDDGQGCCEVCGTLPANRSHLRAV